MQFLNPSSFGMTEDKLMYQGGNVCGFVKFNDYNKSASGFFNNSISPYLDTTTTVTAKFESISIPNRDCIKAIIDRSLLKDRTYLNMAKEISKLGTCLRLQAGCLLLTLEGRVAGAGYNGAGPGMPHCKPETCNDSHRCYRCSHAEMNSLSHKSGQPHTAYVTHEPCLNCARELILAGVKVIKFEKPYTSISNEERKARQEWINHYQIKWEQL